MKNMLMPSDHEDVQVVFAKPAGDILTEDFPPVQYCKSIIFHCWPELAYSVECWLEAYLN